MNERDGLMAVDGVLYKGARRLGAMHPHLPTLQTREHAAHLVIPEGTFRQLTGTVFVFHNVKPDELVFHEIRN